MGMYKLELFRSQPATVKGCDVYVQFHLRLSRLRRLCTHTLPGQRSLRALKHMCDWCLRWIQSYYNPPSRMYLNGISGNGYTLMVVVVMMMMMMMMMMTQEFCVMASVMHLPVLGPGPPFSKQP